MADAAVSARATGVVFQQAMSILQALSLTAWPYPTDCTPTNGSAYDYIVVGADTAGSVLANRLSADGNNSVLVLEAGAYPPIESNLPGLFMFMKASNYDYNYTTTNDNYTMQNLIGKAFSLVQAKVLGGCSSNGHMLYNRGDSQDFSAWANKTNNETWNIDNLLPYYMKQENTVSINKDPRPEAINFLNALKELGNPIVDKYSPNELSLGYAEPEFTIDKGVRQNNALAYLGPAKDRSNLCVSLSSTATKILIENNVAKGVQVTKSGATYLLYAKKEVIVSAGVVGSPKLLMTSGIGPQAHLESLGIETIADLPVGQNFLDQTAVPILFQMDESTVASGASNPHRFPTPTITGNKALNLSSNTEIYQAIILGFEANSTAILNLCSLMFSYSDEVCQMLYEGTTNRKTWLSLIGLTLPESQGNVSLASADPSDAPIIYSGAFSNPVDLNLIVGALMDHSQLLNTSYFKSVNATILDSGLCEGTIYDIEYWRCYALAMSTTMWHCGGTCAIGTVLNNDMSVKGLGSLRVVDSSSMPTLVKGGVAATVGMLAELASELILGCS